MGLQENVGSGFALQKQSQSQHFLEESHHGIIFFKENSFKTLYHDGSLQENVGSGFALGLQHDGWCTGSSMRRDGYIEGTAGTCHWNLRTCTRRRGSSAPL